MLQRNRGRIDEQNIRFPPQWVINTGTTTSSRIAHGVGIFVEDDRGSTVRCASMEPANPNDPITTHVPPRTLGNNPSKRDAAETTREYTEKSHRPHRCAREFTGPTVLERKFTTNLCSTVNLAAEECAFSFSLDPSGSSSIARCFVGFPNNNASAAPRHPARALPSRPRQPKRKTQNPSDHLIVEASTHFLAARSITERLARESILRPRRGCWSQHRYPTEYSLVAPSRRRISREGEKCQSTTPTVCRVIPQRSEAPS